MFAAPAGIERIEIDAPVCGEPFDCESLLQFSALKSVSLSGAVCNLRTLSELEGLNSIQIRYCPDLSGFPPLSSWSGLNYFIAWNVEQDAGKALKKELAALAKTREFEYAAVAQLRKRRGFRANLISPLQTGSVKTAKPRLQNRAKSDQKSKLRARSKGGHRGARGRDK